MDKLFARTPDFRYKWPTVNIAFVLSPHNANTGEPIQSERFPRALLYAISVNRITSMDEIKSLLKSLYARLLDDFINHEMWLRPNGLYLL